MSDDFYCLMERNAAGLWRCSRCHKVHPLPLAKPPKRNCPTAPPLAEVRAARLASAIESAYVSHRLGVTLAEIERRLAVCRACDEFTGVGCRQCTCQDRGAWFAGLTFDAAAEKRWVCEKWMSASPIATSAPRASPPDSAAKNSPAPSLKHTTN